jgi:hypothetical protein
MHCSTLTVCAQRQSCGCSRATAVTRLTSSSSAAPVADRAALESRQCAGAGKGKAGAGPSLRNMVRRSPARPSSKVEVEALVPEPRQLLRQQLLAPSRLEGELVVRDQVRPLLGLAQVLEPDHRDLGEAQLARCEQPTVARQNAGVLVDQDRVGSTKFDHRRRDLVHLRVAVCARVALVRPQLVDRPELDAVGQRNQPGAPRCIGQRRTSWV